MDVMIQYVSQSASLCLNNYLPMEAADGKYFSR